jgi:hypothetical protein
MYCIKHRNNPRQPARGIGSCRDHTRRYSRHTYHWHIEGSRLRKGILYLWYQLSVPSENSSWRPNTLYRTWRPYTTCKARGLYVRGYVIGLMYVIRKQWRSNACKHCNEESFHTFENEQHFCFPYTVPYISTRDVQIRSESDPIGFVRISEPKYSFRIGSDW